MAAMAVSRSLTKHQPPAQPVSTAGAKDAAKKRLFLDAALVVNTEQSVDYDSRRASPEAET